MTEFMNTNKNQETLRWDLLATASAIALLGLACGTNTALAAGSNEDRPQVWIELGTQWSALKEEEEPFAPDFMSGRPSIFSPSQGLEKLPGHSFDEDGRLLILPKGMDWKFTASVRYGQARSKRTLHQQTEHGPGFSTRSGDVIGSIPPYAHQFADTGKNNNESHLVLDFQVGRDMGIGLFGKGGSSTINFGVRLAQFNSKTNLSLKSDPDWHFSYKYFIGLHAPLYQPYHNNTASLEAQRSFHGLGPSISWNASAPIIGDLQDSELTLDWGVNAAMLFGRQRATVHHQSTSYYHSKRGHLKGHALVFQHTYSTARSRSVDVPNVGGFAGLSVRYPNAKLSVGYRADFFLGAMDGGINTRQEEGVSFRGPFATVSIGLGG